MRGLLPPGHRCSHCLSGEVAPLGNVLLVPSGANWKILLLSPSGVRRLPKGSHARSKALSPVTKVLFSPLDVNLRIEWLSMSPANRLPTPSQVMPLSDPTPDAKVVLAPSGVNLNIVPLESATNTLPPRSRARSTRLPSPETKVFFFPSGVNLRIEL